MKTVFKSDELPHLWAHEQISHGRTPGNTSCDGLVFKSYGTVIARIVKHLGRKAFVLDSEGFSVSTSKHQSMVRRAIPGSEKIFHIYKVNRGQTLSEFDQPKNLVAYYYEKSTRVKPVEKLEHKRHEAFLHDVSFLEQAIDCAKFWGLACAKMEKELTKLAPKIKEAREFLNARQSRLEEKEKARETAALKSKVADAIETVSENGSPALLSFEYLCRCVTLLVSRPDLQAKVQGEIDSRTLGAKEG